MSEAVLAVDLRQWPGAIMEMQQRRAVARL